MPDSQLNLYIVDDEASVRTAFARLARSARMQAHTFDSVEEFMAADTSDENACIVCDIMMPGKNGLELPVMMKSVGRRIPFIFVTAHDTPETREIARMVGATAYFRKPVDGQALLDAIAWAHSHFKAGG
jgi:FixJ family two-component response regulator